MNPLGRHILIEFYDCVPSHLSQLDQVREIMMTAAKKGQATIVQDVFHQYSPHGVSGVVVIAESHLAIHTWPEHRYAAVDLFTCSDALNIAAIELFLKSAFGSNSSEKIEVSRGQKAIKAE